MQPRNQLLRDDGETQWPPARVAIVLLYATHQVSRASVPLHSALLVSVVLAVAAAVVVASRLKARRRFANLKVSGGRKSLVMNLFGRS